MKVNVLKSVHMKFDSLIPVSSYTINGSPISVTNEHMDVGLMITSKLSFTLHINSIMSKAYKVLGIMVRRLMSSGSNIKLTRSLYLTVIRSQIFDCCQIWCRYILYMYLNLRYLRN